MSFQSLAREYLRDLERTFISASTTHETTPELSYRPALNTFFHGLAREIDATNIESIFEPKKQRRAGRPDWRFYHRGNLGVYGFVEAKALAVGSIINPADHAEQIARYLTLDQNVLLTDGIDFVFYLKSNNWQPNALSLIGKPLPGTDWHEAEVNLRVEAAFRQFFTSPQPRQCSEEQLVADIAQRAAMLAREISSKVSLNPDEALNENERNLIVKLGTLQRYLASQHDPSLATAQTFAGFVAQVLCFGLLYSHRVAYDGASAPADRYRDVHRYWIDGLSGTRVPLRPFQELVNQLSQELEPRAGEESELSAWYDDCRHLLSFVQLTDEQEAVPDFHELYERFLEKFDPRARFDFGAFYTPKELASFIVGAVDLVAHQEYASSIFSAGNKLIDPCCGTGTFIEQMLTRLAPGQTPTIAGFEILPAPYALAHYRLTLLESLVAERGVQPHILLTNTLSDRLNNPPEEDDETQNLFRAEQDEARVCAAPPIIAVIGNPPSSDSTRAPHQLVPIYTRIDELMNDFRPPADRRTPRQNIQKQLRNDFVRFVRWSADRVVGGERAIIAMVVPESFLEHGSYRYARQWLCERFRSLWVLEIDADQRAGSATDSLFRTLQGRAVVIAAKKPEQAQGDPILMYGSIRDRPLAEKKTMLSNAFPSTDLRSAFAERIDLDSLFRFRPSGSYDMRLWSKSWPLYSSSANSSLPEGEHAIFVRKSSALKLAATSLLVHSDRNLLLRRTREVADPANDFSFIRENWFAGQRRPPPQQKITPLRSALAAAAANGVVSSYALRPFLNVYALLDEGLLTALATMPGGGGRPRPEVRSAFASDANLAFVVAPSRRDIGDDLHRFVSFCWATPDNDLCSRGNAQVLCRLFPEYKSRGAAWNSQPYSNCDPALMSAIPPVQDVDCESSLVYYAYAILCSTEYLEAFSGALFTTASVDTIPRIPITSDADLFRRIVLLGKRMADLERRNAPVSLDADKSARLNAYVEDDSKRVHALRSLEENGVVTLQLVDTNGGTLFAFGPVAPEVASFKVSGYEVLKEWVKWNSYPYTRTPLRRSTIEHFLKTILKIEQQLALLPELDDLVEQIIQSPDDWIVC